MKFYLRKINQNFYSKIPGKTKIAVVLGVILLTIYLYTNTIVNLAYQLPSPQTLTQTSGPLTTEIYDRNGVLLYRFYENQNRSLVTLSDLPKNLINATLSAEDKNFYHHPGFNPISIVRALYRNLRFGSQEGASTITQQVIKNSLLTPEKTVQRKIKEIILAFWAERLYSKDQILELYLNGAPYGGTAWGIEAASQTYFGKSAKDLTLAQSAFLAGLPASPTEFSPYGINPQQGIQRQAWVLSRMEQNGFITHDEAQKAIGEALKLKEPSTSILAPHFVFYVRDLLSKSLGPKVISSGGLKITTTLDINIQTAVEKIVREEIESLTPLNVRNGAAMVTNPSTGEILAMVGSRDYHYPDFGNFNATLALRQPGSSIKVITYATAFLQGYSPGNTILDTPVTFKNPNETYSPKNYDGKLHGPVSIRQALASSYNIPAVKMLAIVGLPEMIQTARSLGITTFDSPAGEPQRYGLSLTLGGGEVKMIDMMAVYGTLASGGILTRPTPIIKVTDSFGNILDEYKEIKYEAISPDVAYILTSILSDNKARTPAFGPNSLLNIPGRQVAVKTGTSDNKRDNWTFGYTPEFVVGVWVGNNDNSPMNQALTSGITGAAPIWNKITRLLIQVFPPKEFVRPVGVIEIAVDGRNDLAIEGISPKGLTRLTKKENGIVFADAFSTFATSSAQAAKESGTN